MESKEELSETEEYNKQEFIEELDIIYNEIKKLEEKAIKLKLETALLALDLSTRIENPETIKEMHLCVENAEEIELKLNESKIESENENKTNSQSNEEENEVIIIEGKESQNSIDVKPNV